MPRALRPDLRYSLVLDSDQEVPQAQQPRFICRHLNGNEWCDVANAADGIDGDAGGAAIIKRAFAAISIALVDWENMIARDGQPIPFAHKDLGQVLGVIEANELLSKILLVNGLDGADRKKSELPLPSNMGESARSANPDGASIPQAESSPSSSNVPGVTVEDAPTATTRANGN